MSEDNNTMNIDSGQLFTRSVGVFCVYVLSNCIKLLCVIIVNNI